MAGARAFRKRSISSPKDEKYQAQAAGSWALKIELSGAATLSVWKVPPSTGRPVWDTWLGELYPTRIRVVGYSWGVFAQRVANTAAPSVVGLLVASAATFNMTVGFINAFLLATALLAILLPETEGRDLQ